MNSEKTTSVFARNWLLGMGFALVLSRSFSAFADNPKPTTLGQKRCLWDDSLEESEARGRAAWAKKCKLLDETFVDFNLKFSMYPSFTHKNGNPKAPTDVNAPCDGWVSNGKFMCEWGCYTPGQEVLFSGQYLKIEDAASQGVSTVTALTKDATLDNLAFAERDIKSFVIGDTKELVYRFTTESGHSLEVTDIHPMIKEDGSVVKASKLVVGEKLINRDGMSEKITKIDTRMFKGTVYNIKPISEEKQENIFVAQELLTGSNRFQNEWIETDFRLNLRKSADISGL